MIPKAAQIINNITTNAIDLTPAREVLKRTRGWSHEGQYVLFNAAVKAGVRSVLVCGVYQGQDLALLQAAAKTENATLDLTGVDLFADAPTADWSIDQKMAGDWKAAGFGDPPSIELAAIAAPGAALFKGHSVEWMRVQESFPKRFDAIYLDTAHDEQTVRDEIVAARAILAPGGVLFGDDYTDGVGGTIGWGVDKAVQSLCPHHVVLFNRFWLAT